MFDANKKSFRQVLSGKNQEQGWGQNSSWGGSFSVYMKAKNEKLQAQFKQIQKDQQKIQSLSRQEQLQEGKVKNSAESNIFKGVSIFVDGITHPTHQELRQLMAMHGGNFENYLDNKKVTHYICSYLPDFKIKLMQKQRNPLPVVKPEWIVNSIDQGKKLPIKREFAKELCLRITSYIFQIIKDFLLTDLRDAPGQKHLFKYKQSEAVLDKGEIYQQLQQDETKDYYQGLKDGSKQQNQNEQLIGNELINGRNKLVMEKYQIKQDDNIHQEYDDTLYQQQQQYQQYLQQEQPQQQLQQQYQLYQQQLQQGQSSEQISKQEQQEQNMPQNYQRDNRKQSKEWDIKNKGLQDGQSPDISKAKQQYNEQYLRDYESSMTTKQKAQNQKQLEENDFDYQYTNYLMNKNKNLNQDQLQQRHFTQNTQAQEAARQLRFAKSKGPVKTTREDPDFVNSYFKASRLHYLGEIKTHNEQIVMEKAHFRPQPSPYLEDQPPKNKAYFNVKHQGAKSIKANNTLDHLTKNNSEDLLNNLVKPTNDRVIVHVDMDCFFAQIAVLDRPQFKNQPVAVCHSNYNKGSGEISSCNYIAREFGVHGGMFMQQAKRLCPKLVVLPYEFKKYFEASEKLYLSLMEYSGMIQPVSCDEAIIDITGLAEDYVNYAQNIKQSVQEATQCTCTVGIGPNQLIARLATKSAKPDGLRKIELQEAPKFLDQQSVEQLPGVGWSIYHKLQTFGINTVRDLKQKCSRDKLQEEIGNKLGAQIWNYAHGIDVRKVLPPQHRRSIGADVNWGVRLDTQEDVQKFVRNLSQEVSNRLEQYRKVAGKQITLKIKRRQINAPEPRKFYGHGLCDNISRSITISKYINSQEDIAKHAYDLLKGLDIPCNEIRGVGIIISKLDSDQKSFFTSPTKIVQNRLPMKRTKYDPENPPGWLQQMYETNLDLTKENQHSMLSIFKNQNQHFANDKLDNGAKKQPNMENNLTMQDQKVAKNGEIEKQIIQGNIKFDNNMKQQLFNQDMLKTADFIESNDKQIENQRDSVKIQINQQKYRNDQLSLDKQDLQHQRNDMSLNQHNQHQLEQHKDNNSTYHPKNEQMIYNIVYKQKEVDKNKSGIINNQDQQSEQFKQQKDYYLQVFQPTQLDREQLRKLEQNQHSIQSQDSMQPQIIQKKKDIKKVLNPLQSGFALQKNQQNNQQQKPDIQSNKNKETISKIPDVNIQQQQQYQVTSSHIDKNQSLPKNQKPTQSINSIQTFYQQSNTGGVQNKAASNSRQVRQTKRAYRSRKVAQNSRTAGLPVILEQQGLPNLSQIDLNVLQALPDDIQNEIYLQYKGVVQQQNPNQNQNVQPQITKIDQQEVDFIQEKEVQEKPNQMDLLEQEIFGVQKDFVLQNRFKCLKQSLSDLYCDADLCTHKNRVGEFPKFIQLFKGFKQQIMTFNDKSGFERQEIQDQVQILVETFFLILRANLYVQCQNEIQYCISGFEKLCDIYPDILSQVGYQAIDQFLQEAQLVGLNIK